MDYTRLIEDLRTVTPFADVADARLALASSLETLGFLLPAHLIRELQTALPPACSPPLEGGVAASHRADRGAGFALSGQELERAQEVCSALGRHLPAELVRDLARELPPPLAQAFAGGAVHQAEDAQPPQRRSHAAGRHLSEAMVGSTTPLASGRPKGAQQESVAVPNPHQDTKLSSARGMTQQREGRSLADSRGRRQDRGD